MTDTVVAEGQVKFRDGKKWKTRWVVLRKPSPVADCLSLLVYKEKKKAKDKGKERLSVTLEGICGVEPGPGYEGVSYTLSILCLAHTLVLGFNNKDALLAWDARIRYSLGEVHRFSVSVEPGTKVDSGPASLHLCNDLLVLTRGVPPVVIGHWKLSALRRYGAVTNGFVFEGGTRCGHWAGVFFLSCSEGEQISFLFDCIVRGTSPSKAPHGVRPALPADPNADPVSAEERISQEASDLEKRLSMLSQCSLASSTASTYSYRTSVAGDDRSSTSGSSSSQSEASYSSRYPFWAEPVSRLSREAASSSNTLRPLTGSDDRLYSAVMGSSGAPRPSSAQQLHHRGLHDSGRQSSLDSGIGIGIATGSQSSYSGSFSSCTGSLETGSQGGGEEFGSVACLPAPPPSSPPTIVPSPLSTPFQSMYSLSSSSSPCPCASRCSSSASRHSEEYHIPSQRYDTPRSLLHTLFIREPTALENPPHLELDSRGSGGDGRSSQGHRWSNTPAGLMAQHQAMMQRSLSWGSERAPSVDSEGSTTPRHMLLGPGGSVCGETQCNQDSDNYITPEQWRSARNRCLPQVANSPSGLLPSASTQEPALCVREEHDDLVDLGARLACLQRPVAVSSPPPSAPPRPPPLSMYRPACGMFQSCREAPPSVYLDTGLHSDSSANYVNVPVSLLPTRANRELLYTQLDLQEMASAAVSSPHSAVREEGSIRYAHLHMATMDTAQRVGAEHVQDRLTQRGPPH